MPADSFVPVAHQKKRTVPTFFRHLPSRVGGETAAIDRLIEKSSGGGEPLWKFRHTGLGPIKMQMRQPAAD